MSEGDYQNDPIFRRIVDQRVRNNIMRGLAHLATGEPAVRAWGVSEYFEAFFDYAPYEGLHSNCAMTQEESDALEAFATEFRKACDAVPPIMEDDAFIATGWPQKLAPLAGVALAVFMKRGFLDSDRADER